MDANRFYHEAISGREGGLHGLARLGLAACVPFYRAAIGVHALTFDAGLRKVHRAPVPVISVGNLTTGGTGKTPTVAWIVNRLLCEGMQPAILSRGYRSLDEGGNDEKRLLDAICPGVPHLQNRDRAASAQRAVEEFGCGVVVLDDGFQHRRLHRDLDIVLIDAVNPWGHGHLLPRGLLREPRSALGRADVVIVTRADLTTESAREQLAAEIGRWTPAPVCVSRFQPTGWISNSGKTSPLHTLAGKRIAAFCGIGNPEGFARTLAGSGITFAEEQFRVFPDHHHYSAEDLHRLNDWSDDLGAECLVTTRKDLVKVAQLSSGSRPIRALDISLEIDDPEPLISQFEAIIDRRRRRLAA